MNLKRPPTNAFCFLRTPCRRTATAQPSSRHLSVHLLYATRYSSLTASTRKRRTPDSYGNATLIVNAVFSFALMPRRDDELPQIESSLNRCRCKTVGFGEYITAALRFVQKDFPDPDYGPGPYSNFAFCSGLIFTTASALIRGLHSTTLKNVAGRAGEERLQDRGVQRMHFYLIGDGAKDTISSSLM